MRRDVFAGRLAFALTALALAYSATLLVWVIGAESGPWSPAIFVQPLLVSLLVGALLRRRCTTGSRTATGAAWLVAALYLVWSVVAGFSLAAGALPAALLLALAVSATPSPARDYGSRSAAGDA